jgi:hypothetical protein
MAHGHLLVGAMFFAMRSCEYSQTNKANGIRKTRIITIENVRFFDTTADGHNKEFTHPTPFSTLHKAKFVSITFVSQKNGEKMETITQHRTTSGTLCPVVSWAFTVCRILGYDKTTITSTVNTYFDTTTGKLGRITAKQSRERLRSAVRILGTNKLGIDIERVGTHSLRTSCAMLLYLAKVRTATIMLLGRWKSDAFLLYLRKQVKEFTSGISDMMVNQAHTFYTVPNARTPPSQDIFTADADDPGTQNADSIASHTRFNGPGLRTTNASTIDRLNPPAFHLWGQQFNHSFKQHKSQ